MFFCRLGRVVAWVAFIGGAFVATMGFMAAQGMDTSEYFTARTSGQAIDAGLKSIVYAAVIGALSEIGLTLSKKT